MLHGEGQRICLGILRHIHRSRKYRFSSFFYLEFWMNLVSTNFDSRELLMFGPAAARHIFLNHLFRFVCSPVEVNWHQRLDLNFIISVSFPGVLAGFSMADHEWETADIFTEWESATVTYVICMMRIDDECGVSWTYGFILIRNKECLHFGRKTLGFSLKQILKHTIAYPNTAFIKKSLEITRRVIAWLLSLSLMGLFKRKICLRFPYQKDC